MKIKYLHILYFASFLLLVFIAYISFRKALDFYFWKDDWAWLWDANLFPPDFYNSTGGDAWLVRTGPFMYLYVLVGFKFIQSAVVWQNIGLLMKIINSVVFYFLAKIVLKDNKKAFLGALIFASYSGGMGSYAWHKLNALTTTFTMIGFIFYSRLLETFNKKFLIFSFLFFILAFSSYVGRASGIIPTVLGWNFLSWFDSKITAKKRIKLISYSLAVVVPYLVLIVYVSSVQRGSDDLNKILENTHLFFGIVGNLLKNSIVYYDQIGELANPDTISYVLGFAVFAIGVASAIAYLKSKKDFFKLVCQYVVWIYAFYFINWIFGGGGIYTFVSSTHRYVAIAGVGVVMLYSLLISRFKYKIALALTILLVALNLSYSNKILTIEGELRNSSLIVPIHQKIMEKTIHVENPRFLLIHTPNKLKSYVVLGWFPYTYAYYKEIDKMENFPTVFPFWDHAIVWLCGTDNEKIEVLKNQGVVDYQAGKEFDENDIFAWELRENGELIDRTDNARMIFTECNDQK